MLLFTVALSGVYTDGSFWMFALGRLDSDGDQVSVVAAQSSCSYLYQQVIPCRTPASHSTRVVFADFCVDFCDWAEHIDQGYYGM